MTKADVFQPQGVCVKDSNTPPLMMMMMMMSTRRAIGLKTVDQRFRNME